MPTNEKNIAAERNGLASASTTSASNLNSGVRNNKSAQASQVAESEVDQYFRDLSSSAILNRDQELSLTTELVRSREHFKKELFQHPEAASHLSELLKTIRTGERNFRIIIDDPKNQKKSGRDNLFKNLPRLIERIESTARTVESLLPKAPDEESENILLLERSRGQLAKHCLTHNLKETCLDTIAEQTCKAIALSRKEESSSLKHAWETYKSYKGQLAQHNLTLVVSIAKRYCGPGIDFGDLIQEGNLGLMRACEKFQPEKGYRFGTYASWWIESSVRTGLVEQRRTIRLPQRTQQLIRQVSEVSDDIAKQGKTADDRTIAEKLSVRESQVKSIKPHQSLPVSLEQSQSAKEANPITELLSDETTEDFFSALQSNELKTHFEHLFETRLTKIEREVIKLRFGLDSFAPHSLEKIAEKFGAISGKNRRVTRERVRQLEKRALEKLKVHLPRHNLDYFNEDESY